MIDDVTGSVRSLYEAFPYPERMPGGASDPYLDLVMSFSASSPTRRSAFLDAGCGTGVNLLGAATLYPHFDVWGCDINRTALQEIRGDIEAYGLPNARVDEVELSELASDYGPESGFEVIFCTGVLHHVGLPEEALRRLAARLAPQGVLRLMVYSERGRSDLYRFARAAQKLWPAHAWPMTKRVELARSLMGELGRHFQAGGASPPPLRGTWADANTVGDAEFADRYLHPHDKPYAPAGLKALIEGAGLRFLDWFEPRDWDLARLLPELSAGPDAPLDFWDQVELLDELFERPKYDMYLVGPDFQRREVEVGASTLLATSPQLFLEQVTVRGNPLAYGARLRTGDIEGVTHSEGRLLTALGRRFASIRDLCSEWDAEPTAALLDEAQSLLERGFLYSPHPPTGEDSSR